MHDRSVRFLERFKVWSFLFNARDAPWLRDMMNKRGGVGCRRMLQMFLVSFYCFASASNPFVMHVSLKRFPKKKRREITKQEMKQQIRWKKDILSDSFHVVQICFSFFQNLLKSDFEIEPILLFHSLRLHHARFMWTNFFVCNANDLSHWNVLLFARRYCCSGRRTKFCWFQNKKNPSLNFNELWNADEVKKSQTAGDEEESDEVWCNKFHCLHSEKHEKYLQTCKFSFSMLLNLERVRMCISAGL